MIAEQRQSRRGKSINDRTMNVVAQPSIRILHLDTST